MIGAKVAYEISELVEMGPMSRSKLYEKIGDGSLKARRLDKKTVVLDADWRAFFDALPAAELGANPVKPRGAA